MKVDHEVVLYMKQPLDRAALERIVSILDGPVEDLVRKDSQFKKLALRSSDYVGKPKAVVDILVRHKALLQRPLLVAKKRAIVGRPKAKVVEFLSGL